MSQAETKATTKRHGNGTALIHSDNALTLAERINLIRVTSHEVHAAHLAEKRDAFESRLVEMVHARIDRVLDGILGE